MDGAGHIFQAGAHFQGLGERRGQFRDADADGLPTEDQVIVATRDHAHETAF
ncbi:hypothetical protein D3C79_1081730 [compost metagenome]